MIFRFASWLLLVAIFGGVAGWAGYALIAGIMRKLA